MDTLVGRNTRSRTEKLQRLKSAEKKLSWSCHQISLLNDKLQGVITRYTRAKAEGHKSFRYNLRLRIAAVEGLTNVFREYAQDRAEEIAELRQELFNMIVTIFNTRGLPTLALTGYYDMGHDSDDDDDEDDEDDMDFEDYAAYYNDEEDLEIVTTDDGEDSSEDEEGDDPEADAMDVEEPRR